MVWEDLKPSDILTAASFDNAISCRLAMGGSTNAMVHSSPWRAAPASRSTSTASTQLARQMPVLANVRPSGKYLMEDFFYAGGMPRAAGRAQATCSIWTR